MKLVIQCLNDEYFATRETEEAFARYMSNAEENERLHQVCARELDNNCCLNELLNHGEFIVVNIRED